MTTRVVRAACPHDCPDTCAMLVTVTDGVATEIRGDPEHPNTGGVLCTKVARYLERTYHPERLLPAFDHLLEQRIQLVVPGAMLRELVFQIDHRCFQPFQATAAANGKSTTAQQPPIGIMAKSTSPKRRWMSAKSFE